MSWYKQAGDTITLTLHAQPGARKSAVAGLHGDALKVRIAAPPVDGKANEALIAFVAKLFDVPRKQVRLLTGDTSRHKRLEVTGSAVNPESLLQPG
jgi:hypothetical protein